MYIVEAVYTKQESSNLSDFRSDLHLWDGIISCLGRRPLWENTAWEFEHPPYTGYIAYTAYTAYIQLEHPSSQVALSALGQLVISKRKLLPMLRSHQILAS